MNTNENLKILLSEIIQGYSYFVYDKKFHYIKHLNYLDSSHIDLKRQEYIEIFKLKGAKTNEDKIKDLINDGIWSEAKDKEIVEYRDYIANLNITKKQYNTRKDKELIQKDIDNYTIKLTDLALEKSKLIGITADNQADLKINEYIIYFSLFTTELQERFYTFEEFNYLDEKEIYHLRENYNSIMSRFSERNLKKISLLPQFFNLFCLTGDNIFSLFGKPLIELTLHQTEIIQYSKMYKNILQNSKIQPSFDVLNDYDKLVDWFDSNINENKALQESNNDPNSVIDAGSIVGLSKQELKERGIDTSENEKIERALKSKGELNLDDLMKM